jgi:uncharacterized protein YqjF (DUF2071 family)
MGDERVFLSAEWRDLVMLNYEVDPQLLSEYVPRGTELDSFGGKTYVSLVGFRFLRTKLFGVLPLPFHSNFDEVNLRFYVRRREGDEERRGVVFIREIVPKRAVAWLARMAYGENYSRYPMRHLVSANGGVKSAEYEWRLRGSWAKLHAEGEGDPGFPGEGSLEQFITEHYWGYSALPGSIISRAPLTEASGALSFRGPRSPSLQRDGGTIEYHVTHPQWRVWQGARAGFEGDGGEIYGGAFAQMLRRSPDSAFIAEGSPVVVFKGRRIA